MLYTVPAGAYSFYYLFLWELDSHLHLGAIGALFLAGKAMTSYRQARRSCKVQSIHLDQEGKRVIFGFYHLDI